MQRRAFLVAFGATLAGCGGSEAGGTPSVSPSPTATTSPTPTDQPTPIDYLRRFREALMARDVAVARLVSGGVQASLTYTLADASTAAVEGSLRDVAMAMLVPIELGWSVEGVNVSIVHRPTDQAFATYRIESRWARKHLEGSIESAGYTNRILETLRVNPGAIPTPTATPSPTPEPQETAAGIDLGGEDTAPSDAFASLAVDYHSRTVETIDPPSDDHTYEAWTSHEILAVQLRITNEGGAIFHVYPSAFDVRTAEKTIAFFQLEHTSNPLDGVSLSPGDTTEGWIPYQVYEAVTAADLVFDQSVYFGSVACTFDRDPSLEVEL